MGILQEVPGELVVEGDVLALLQPVVNDETGDEDGGKHGSDDTDDERGGEALDRTGTEEEQHETGEEGGHLTVDDGGVSVAVTILDGLADALAGTELFLDALIDDNVGIHCHTQSQHQTCDTREGEDRSERCEGTEEEEDVGEQGEVSHETGSLVEENHVNEHQEECHEEGDETLADRLGTEGRTHNLLLDDRSRSGKLTGLEDVGKVGGLLDGEVAGDGGGTSGNLGLDGRIGIHGTVEDDGDLTADVVLGDACPGVGTLGVHGHGDTGSTCATAAVIVDAGVGDDGTVERGLAVTGRSLDGDEFVHIVTGYVFGRLDRPHALELRREDLSDLRHGKVAVDSSGVDGVGEADAGVTAHLGRAEDGEERVGLLVGIQLGVAAFLLCELLGYEILGLAGSLGLTLGGLFGSRSLVGKDLGEEVVGLYQVRIDLRILVSGPELEGSSTLKEFADTLRLLDTRELDEDAAGVADLLDRGLGDSETVDTVAEDVEGVGDSALGLGLDDIENLGVGGLGLDLVTHLIGTEDLGKPLAAGNFVPSLSEEGDEVGGGVDAALLGESEGPVELGSLVVAGESLNEVLELHLQHDVHTTLEVKAKVDLLGLHVLELITEINFLGRDGIGVPPVLVLPDGVEIESSLRLGNLVECS